LKPIRKILCPIDCSPGCGAAVDYALALAQQCGAEVHVLHVWQLNYHVRHDLSVWMEVHGQTPIAKVVEKEARDETDKFVASLPSEARARIKVHVVEGEPLRTVVDLATRDGFDLIAMGTHGRSGIMHIAIGSVAEKVVRHSACPVLTVRLPAAT
jgi:nucleotide-binding universal stress UspA family protein